jgi:potassium efflux system protein
VGARAEVVDILSGFALFADLTTPELESIVQTFDEVYFSEGERVIRQGLTATGLYVIIEGSASIIVSGKERSSLRPGDFFGEISCLLGEPPTADIVASHALRCLVLAPHAVEEFLIAHPHVMYRVLQGEARKLRTTTRWLS